MKNRKRNIIDPLSTTNIPSVGNVYWLDDDTIYSVVS